MNAVYLHMEEKTEMVRVLYWFRSADSVGRVLFRWFRYGLEGARGYSKLSHGEESVSSAARAGCRVLVFCVVFVPLLFYPYDK